jgi:hypothetical protein
MNFTRLPRLLKRLPCLLTIITSLIIVSASVLSTNAYKLNVPKVLLPFHSSKQISFILEAKADTETLNEQQNNDLCFVWSSSRPDIVSIIPIYEPAASVSNINNNRECTRKALVTAVSKHAQRLTSIILARETSWFFNV